MNKGFYVSFYKETNVCEEKGCWAAYLPRGNSALLGFVLNCDDQKRKILNYKNQHRSTRSYEKYFNRLAMLMVCLS